MKKKRVCRIIEDCESAFITRCQQIMTGGRKLLSLTTTVECDGSRTFRAVITGKKCVFRIMTNNSSAFHLKWIRDRTSLMSR